MSAPIAGGTAINAGVPKALFEARVPLTGNPYRTSYTVTADGRRFLVNTIPEGSTSPPITVVLNWMAALRK